MAWTTGGAAWLATTTATLSTSAGTCRRSLSLLQEMKSGGCVAGPLIPPHHSSSPVLTAGAGGCWCGSAVRHDLLRGGRRRSPGVKVVCTDWQINRLTDRHSVSTASSSSDRLLQNRPSVFRLHHAVCKSCLNHWPSWISVLVLMVSGQTETFSAVVTGQEWLHYIISRPASSVTYCMRRGQLWWAGSREAAARSAGKTWPAVGSCTCIGGVRLALVRD